MSLFGLFEISELVFCFVYRIFIIILLMNRISVTQSVGFNITGLTDLDELTPRWLRM